MPRGVPESRSLPPTERLFRIRPESLDYHSWPEQDLKLNAFPSRRLIREGIGHCIYGVDINPMAVELCKVSLWMEAMELGKPLSFLEHRIQVGNSLLGTIPQLLAGGIQDEAF